MIRSDNMKKKHIETSKKVLIYALIIDTVLLVVVTIGWFNNLADAYQWFFGVIAFFIATVVGYFFMCIFINPTKIKCGANILPDLLNIFSAMFNSLNSCDIPSAINNIINASQMIVQNHPELTRNDIPKSIQDYQYTKNINTQNQSNSMNQDIDFTNEGDVKNNGMSGD